MIEDDVLVAEAVSTALLSILGEVKCFYWAEDALACPEIANADYFIVDYMLSEQMNGIQFLNQIRQRLGKPIKAVMMTGDTSTEFIRKAEMFDWPVVHKPVSLSRLISKLTGQNGKHT